MRCMKFEYFRRKSGIKKLCWKIWIGTWKLDIQKKEKLR